PVSQTLTQQARWGRRFLFACRAIFSRVVQSTATTGTVGPLLGLSTPPTRIVTGSLSPFEWKQGTRILIRYTPISPGSRPLHSTIISDCLYCGLPKYTLTVPVTASGFEGDGSPAVTLPPLSPPF